MLTEDNIRYQINKIRDKIFQIKTKKLAKELEKILESTEGIPVILVSYNNAKYVLNSLKQLKNYNITPIIIDNNSTDESSLSILKAIQKSGNANVIFSEFNFGYLVGFLNPIYEVLPKYFAYSDPDLEFNPHLPKDFLEILKELTKRYKVYKAGFALKLLKDENIIKTSMQKLYGVPKIYKKELNLIEWEEQYWRFKLSHPSLEVYAGKLDTTFAVYNKDNLIDDFYEAVRVAGDFSAIHLPWYPQLDILNKNDKQVYLKGNKSSTWIK